MQITKTGLRDIILEVLSEQMTGAEMYARMKGKSLPHDYYKNLANIRRARRAEKEPGKEAPGKEAPEEIKPTSLKKLDKGIINVALNQLRQKGIGKEVFVKQVEDAIKTIARLAGPQRTNFLTKDVPTINKIKDEIAKILSGDFSNLVKESNKDFYDVYQALANILSERYVINKKDPISIKEVITNWTNGERASEAEEFHATYPIDDVLEYRSFSVDYNKLPLEEMEKLKKDLREIGAIKPIVIEVGKNGQAAVAHGNQIIELAKQINIKELPVAFVFKEFVQKASKVTEEPTTINKAVEDQEEKNPMAQSMIGRGSSLGYF